MLKRKRLDVEDEATRCCNRPDGCNRLVERDDVSGAKSFFNSNGWIFPSFFSVLSLSFLEIHVE